MTVTLALLAVAMSAGDGMAHLPAGSFVPLYSQDGLEKAAVQSFWLDKLPVTNRRFLEFTASHPEWSKERAKRIFADPRYLRHWKNLKEPDDLDKPVVNVSWFAASAYCESLGKRLPTTDEWEYALDDRGRDREKVDQLFIDWCGADQRELPRVGSRPANGFGIHDLAGVTWEWTSDFNGFMASPDSRDSGEKFFCGGSSLNAANPRDYPAFMRYSYRASLQGNFTGESLGFRCAKDAK